MGLQQTSRELKALYFHSSVLGQVSEIVVWSIEMSSGTVRDHDRADEKEVGCIQGNNKARCPEFSLQREVRGMR